MIIPDPLLEGAVCKLVAMAELAGATFSSTRADGVAVLDGLRECASDVRTRLNTTGGST